MQTAIPKGGRVVTLTSSNSKDLLLSNSATAVGTGSITLSMEAATSSGPTFYAQALVSSGTATITESIPGYNNTVITVNFTPSGFIVQGGTATTTFSAASPVLVTFAQLAPTTREFMGEIELRPGATAISVPLKNSNAAAGTLASSSIAFKSGDSQHQTTFQPKGTGISVISFASTLTGYSPPANLNTTTFTVTAPNSEMALCNSAFETVGAVNMGFNSLCSGSPELAVAAPKGGSVVTLTSSNPSALLISKSPTTVGTASITLNIPAGSTTGPQFYAQALVSTGTATITESIPDYNPTVTTVTFTPSGFILQGGTDTTTFSAPSAVLVTFAQLDPKTLAFTGELTLRPGLAAIAVGLKDSNAAVGTLGSTSIAFNSGDSQHQTTFHPTGTAAGTAIIGFTATLPHYSASSNLNTTTFTVTAPNSEMALCSSAFVGSGTVAMGFNGVCSGEPELQTAAPTGGRTVTLTSSDPTKLLLSKSATTVGSSSITLNIAAASSSGPQFFAQALVNKGSATITETIPGYNPTTVTVDFTPSGFILQGGTSTTSFSGPSPVFVTFAQLDPTTLDFTGEITLRPGLTPITAKLADSSSATVGSLVSSTLVFNSGDSQHQVNFQPAGAGTAVISFSSITPSTGYSTSSNLNTTTFTVTAPNSELALCNSAFVGTGTVAMGFNSVCTGTPEVQAAIPAGGRTVTLTSSNPAELKLSTSATAVGTTSITLSMTAGSSSGPQFFAQALVASGTATITESIPGYNHTVITVSFTPSGFILQGGTATTTLSAASPVFVTFAQLSPSTLQFEGQLTLRPGLTAITVPLSNSSTAGTLASSSIVFNSGDSQHQTTFKPAGVGTSIIGFVKQPTGYTGSSNLNTTTFTVALPSTSIQPVTVGNFLQNTTFADLAQPAPTGGRKVTITSPSPKTIVLSLSNTTMGTASISFNLTAGQSSTPTFFVQSVAAGQGTVTLGITASGYAAGTGTVTIFPSGFALQGSNFTTTIGDNPTTLTIVPAALDPMFLNVFQVQQLIPNPPTPTATLTLTVETGTTVGTFSVNPVTFKGADNPNFLTSSFVPKGVGTALIKITSPKTLGYSNASTEITATVVSP